MAWSADEIGGWGVDFYSSLSHLFEDTLEDVVGSCKFCILHHIPRSAKGGLIDVTITIVAADAVRLSLVVLIVAYSSRSIAPNSDFAMVFRLIWIFRSLSHVLKQLMAHDVCFTVLASCRLPSIESRSSALKETHLDTDALSSCLNVLGLSCFSSSDDS